MSGTEVLSSPGETGGLDRFELEVRRLVGVSFVGIDHRSDPLSVEVAASGVDIPALRAEVHRLAVALLDGPVTVEILGRAEATGARARVRVEVTPPLAGGSSVELHLSHHQRRVMVEADGSDDRAVAEAVVAGLGALGLTAPWDVARVHDLPGEAGGGVLVVLDHRRTGETRPGLARGRSRPEALARAVLNALNRFLEPSAGTGDGMPAAGR